MTVDSYTILPKADTRVIQRQAQLPLPLDTVKSHLNIWHNESDGTVARMFESACLYIEKLINVYAQPVTLEWHGPYWPMRLQGGPFNSLQSIWYWDADGNPAELDLSTEAFAIRNGDSFATLEPQENNWPRTAIAPDAVRIRWTAGFTTMPADLQHAALVLAGHWYENREAVGQNLTPIGLSFGSLLESYRSGFVPLSCDESPYSVTYTSVTLDRTKTFGGTGTSADSTSVTADDETITADEV